MNFFVFIAVQVIGLCIHHISKLIFDCIYFQRSFRLWGYPFHVLLRSSKAMMKAGFMTQSQRLIITVVREFLFVSGIRVFFLERGRKVRETKPFIICYLLPVHCEPQIFSRGAEDSAAAIIVCKRLSAFVLVLPLVSCRSPLHKRAAINQ